MRILAPLLVAAAMTTGCDRDPAGNTRAPVTVFAAASTTDVLTEIARQYEKAGGGPVRFSFASSSTAARQIAQGAPADVFISADERWMDSLAEHDFIAKGTRRDLLGNRLVLIAPKGRSFGIAMDRGVQLAGQFSGRLAVGDPEHVPAGIYARAALQHMGWWEALKDRLAPGADVRDALRFVELAEADAGIVYATDAARSDKVVVVAVFPADSHPPIRYPVAMTKNAGGAAKAFMDYLRSPAAGEVFTRYGFEVLVED